MPKLGKNNNNMDMWMRKSADENGKSTVIHVN